MEARGEIVSPRERQVSGLERGEKLLELVNDAVLFLWVFGIIVSMH